MNIVFYHTNEIVPKSGGISRTTDNLGKVFRNHGHNVWFIGVKRIGNNEVDKMQIIIPEFNDAECQTQFFVDFINKNKIDIIINQCPLNKYCFNIICKVKKATGVKIISCLHNSITTPVKNIAYQMEYALKKKHIGFIFTLLKQRYVSKFLLWCYCLRYRKKYVKIIETSENTVVLCKGLKEELQELTGITKIPKCSVIPNYCPEIPNNISDKKKQVLWVGTFDIATKRPDFILKVWKEIYTEFSDWKLILLGDGKDFEEMTAYSKALGLNNVLFKGRVEPSGYYKDSQIVVVTSTHESFSLVTVEALSYNCIPIVINSFPAASMLIKDEYGVLIQPFDESSFINELRKLLSNTFLRNKMIAYKEKGLDRFSAENVYTLWFNLFKEI